jgi:NAD(P)-dependent dehydrogenase (short-subunit alcohol dehydrogenase family)
MQRLKSKCAFITGAAGGIGLEIARCFGAEGARVVLADVSQARLSKAENTLRDAGIDAFSCCFDLAKVEGHGAVLDRTEAGFHPVDILVNCAGLSAVRPIEDLSPEDWDSLMSVNLRGTFFLTQAAYIRMKKRGWGRIISISSISGERGARVAGAHYSISKAGVIMMTKAFALSAADCGVTVNTISPGIINTEMTARLGTVIRPEDVPLNRIGTPEDVAKTAVFLASDDAAYLTGQNISVNGGQSMR